MALPEDIKNFLAGLPAKVEEKNGLITATCLIAERKSFLSKKSLSYIAKLRIDQAKQEVRFTEMLKEGGWGVSGGDLDSSPGFGFKAETYKTGSGPREGTIQEQSVLFGQKYSYTFDFNTIRGALEQKARAAGFNFKYQITPIGL